MNKEDDVITDLPPSTVMAIKNIIPNLPYLIIDATQVILTDEVNVS